MSRRGWVLFLAIGVIWGLPYLFIKIAVADLSPASIVFLRTSIAALLLVPVAAIRGQLRPLLPHWRPLLAFSAAEMGVPWFLLSTAEQRLSSSLAGLLIAAVPLVSAALGWFTGTDRLDWWRVTGLVVGIVGVAALVGLDLGGGDALALVQMAGVVICYAVGPFIFARRLAHLPGLGVVSAAILLSALAYAVPGTMQLPERWPPTQTMAAVGVLGLVCTATAFLVFFRLVDEVGPVRSSVITYVNPAVAVALGVVWLAEPFTVGMAVGFVLILAGSGLSTRRSASADSPGAADPEGAPASFRKTVRSPAGPDADQRDNASISGGAG